MSNRVLSAALTGLDADLVEVEADLGQGLPSFTIVGLPDTAVQEARERVRSAMKHSGLPFPRGRVTVNLAPADLKKAGAGYDLPVALAILLAGQVIETEALRNCLVVGELSLQGEVRPARGVLSMALAARVRDIQTMFVPRDNAVEAAVVPGVKIYSIDRLLDLVKHLKNETRIVPTTPTPRKEIAEDLTIDLKYIRGQTHAKRSLEIAAAGGHNVLLRGIPGSGKTLLARALVGILPRMTVDESMEVTRLYSAAGLLAAGEGLVQLRPFRSPHHTASTVALVGGGTNPRPGEISLAHRGVLFLDELPEFGRSVLEALRQPLEDGVVTVSRAAAVIRFPAQFTLVASQNPCPCGFFGDPSGRCTCLPPQIIKYSRRVSGPVRDRIDLHVDVRAVPFKELAGPEGEPSAEVRRRVERARSKQTERFQGRRVHTNSEMSLADIKKYCRLDAAAMTLVARAVERLHLSARAYHRILKVSRTIADLGGSQEILAEHVAEAIQYRSTDLRT